MRTPEQRVAFLFSRLNVAQTAKDRAERKIADVQYQKTSALQYAKNNVAHADRAFSDSELKLQRLCLRLGKAEKESESLKEKARLASQEVESYGSMYDFALESAIAYRDTLERKRVEAEAEHTAAVEDLNKVTVFRDALPQTTI